ncbi:AAA family ATPase [Microbacterium sp. CFBP9023]|uniref:AAA family ATPase n=1 Tax=Microbacterium sp. CFBP9023 TaxID=3096535 RepID=UPI002A6A3734|nr:AAA family ATPase [Microbacterium sp. CFBP9023]MDY0983154.1 AAA family ATPase [Microbacterium sp. CFBP9023]
MYISHLDLRAYRRFETFTIDFDRSLTVIAARNGQGKTTVLEAIASALGPFVGAFDDARGQHLLRTDAHRRVVGTWPTNEPVYPVVVAAELIDDSGSSISWSRRLNSGKKSAKTTIKEAAPLAQWGKQLQEEVRAGSRVDLPVIAYYSSKRLWLSHKNHGLRSSGILVQSRTAAYSECLSSTVSSFAQIELWMQRATLASMQARTEAGAAGEFESQLAGISRTVDMVMSNEGWSDFRYSFALDELSLTHRDHGELPVSILSDGVRAVVSLVADLALRCVRLNPHLGERASGEGRGVVMIDEVDLHLHPAWQQRIVARLREAFPNIQFILTTHSPQVLSTVERKSIRIVSRDGEGRWFAATPGAEVKGLESSVALNDVMGVDPVPAVAQSKLISDYTVAIERGEQESDEGRRLRGELEDFYGSTHRVLRDADRLTRFQQMKLRAEGKKGSAGDRQEG